MKPAVLDAPDAIAPNLSIAWYESWHAEQDARLQAERAAAAQMRRGIRWMVVVLAVWSVAAAGGVTLILWTGA